MIKSRLRILLCVILIIVTAPLYAQDAQAESESVTKEEGVAESTAEDQAVEEYNIYRKNNPENPCERDMDTYDYQLSWYDQSQIYINSTFCEPALWFDNFFANDRVFAEGVAGTYIRWRHEFIQDEETRFSYKTGITASLELPRVNKRLRLTFESDADEHLRDLAPGNSEDTANTLGLQYDLLENIRSKINITVSLQPRIRLRYRYTYPIFEKLTLRLTQELQRQENVHSSRTLIDFERLFNDSYLFRASTEAQISEDFDGFDWLQAFALYRRLDKKTSFSYEASVNGITKPTAMPLNYRLGIRYRKNFHREWLFYEIAPEITWPVTLDDARNVTLTDRRSKWQLFFRLEVHFGNAYKKRYQDYN